jgi:hypothetical protein
MSNEPSKSEIALRIRVMEVTVMGFKADWPGGASNLNTGEKVEMTLWSVEPARLAAALRMQNGGPESAPSALAQVILAQSRAAKAATWDYVVANLDAGEVADLKKALDTTAEGLASAIDDLECKLMDAVNVLKGAAGL